MFLSAIVGIRLIGNTIIAQAQDKVRLDLNTAREIYRKEGECTKKMIRLTSIRFFLIDAILNGDFARIEGELQKIRVNESLDILNFIDAQGYVRVRARNPERSGDKLEDEILQWVLSNREAVFSTKILSESMLEKEGESIVDQVRIKLVPTPKAKPRSDTVETSGMAIVAAAPVFDYEGNIMGVLYGGRVLNRNFEIVDRVKDIVYRGEKHRGRDIGTATIFQDDLRVATNVRTLDGERAIGTRVSQEVYDQVIGQGFPWVGRAFVVNAWYITAYEPIRNIHDEIIGMLYVGMLEAPYVDLRRRVIFIFLGIAFVAVILLTVIAFFTANMITKPIKELVFATRKVAQGDLTYEVKRISNDEIGELARSFNKMTKSLSRAEQELKDWAKTLEKKVRERTRELELAQQQLLRSEKLASLGKMAAGVAHEINNPLTAVLTFSKLMLDDLEENDERREDLETIVDETLRCRDIVRGLLDFSRETASQKKPKSINGIIEDTFSLIRNQAMFHDITIEKHLEEALPEIPLDEAKMKQVFMNMFLNAAEAMSGHGTLTIGTSHENGTVVVRIKDTGCGIPKGHLNKLFDPFFTTKKVGKGTGLGLAVTYGIVKNHGGTFQVNSVEGKGTEFIIRFPVRPALAEDKSNGAE